MFQKLRADLVSKLAGIKLLLVNAGGWGVNGDVSLPCDLGINGNHKGALFENGVNCIAYCEGVSQEISSVAESLSVELHQGISNKSNFYSKIKSECCLSDFEIVLICRDSSDLCIVDKVNFSAVTPEAPLEVKSHSYFATYEAGVGALGEIASLIIKAKTYPSGWSE